MATHVRQLTSEKRFLILVLLEDIVYWILNTIVAICFIKAILVETLSNKTRSVFSWNLPVMRTSLGLVHNWDSDQTFLAGIETQFLFPTVLFWLTPLLQKPWIYSLEFLIPDGLKHLETLDNEHTKSFYFQVIQSFPLKCESFFLQSCPIEFSRFLWKWKKIHSKEICKA